MNTINNYKNGEFINYTADSILSDSQKESLKLDEASISVSGTNINYMGDYTYILPNGLNIFKNYREIENISNLNVKKQAIEFLFKFQNILLTIKDRINFSGSLPPLTIEVGDDGSVLIEWIFKDFRMGFAFEENEQESSWYFLSNQKFGNIDISGSFINTDIYKILEQSVIVLLANQ
ncbi:MAG: hypothetical protein ACYDEE_03760 [Ignavibacteriaceae bacterium]